MKNNPPTVAVIETPKREELSPNTLGQGKLEELIRYIESRYVDDVNKDELVKEAIDNILYQLDPHSSYITADQLKLVNEQLEGSFDGIGIEFVVVEDTVMVITALEGGPSDLAGIRAGDRIVQIEDTLTLGENIDYEGILGKLRGESGSKIKIGVRRGNDAELTHFTVMRGKIPMKSVEAGFMLDKETGYIKISRFSSKTYQEFLGILGDLVIEDSMKNLILDLRQNPGGYLQEAVNILNQLFEKKDMLLVYTEGKNVPRNDYKSTGRPFYKMGNIAVLTDEGSASASEIIAGAIQDHDRGVIIGRRSFGKGLVQEQYRLRDGSAIRLTVARYYTPSGRCIQKSYESREHYDEDVADRIKNGELYSESKIEIEDTTRYFTDGDRVVYGGGGIQPDIFVPLDSFLLNTYYIHLNQQIPSFAFRYVDSNREALEETGLEEFAENFKVSETLLNGFHDFALKQGVKKNDKSWKAVQKEISQSLKANIARYLWSETGFQLVMNRDDPAVKKALAKMKEKEPVELKKKPEIR